MNSTKTKKIALMGILSALAIIIGILMRIPFFPSAPFLSYDSKDVIIAIAGFILGPLEALAISLVSSLIEIPFSGTGIIGFLMNFISTASFACVASLVYKKKRTLSGAIFGLSLGVILMTAVMVLWNYIVTPIYQGVPRDFIVPMLPTVFMPFNLIKGVINACLTLILYKPVVTIARETGFIEKSDKGSSYFKISVLLISLFVLASCVTCVIIINVNK